MTTEFDLTCATCGGPLARRRVGASSIRDGATGTVDVAECVECGSRYVPETTLERL